MAILTLVLPLWGQEALGSLGGDQWVWCDKGVVMV